MTWVFRMVYIAWWCAQTICLCLAPCAQLSLSSKCFICIWILTTTQDTTVSYTPPRILLDSIRSPDNPSALLLDSCYTPAILPILCGYSWNHPYTIHMDYTWSLHGLRGLHMEPPWTPQGEYRDCIYFQPNYHTRSLSRTLYTNWDICKNDYWWYFKYHTGLSCIG